MAKKIKKGRKVDFSVVLRDWEGEELHQESTQGGDREKLTLKTVCLTALGTGYQDDDQDAKTKMARFALGFTIARRKDHIVELVPSETVMLGKLIARKYLSPLIVAQALWLIDPSQLPSDSRLTDADFCEMFGMTDEDESEEEK